MRTFLSPLFLLCPTLLFAGTDPLRLGQPSDPQEGQVLVVHRDYAALFDTRLKTPVWVAEQLLKSDVFGRSARAHEFVPDPQVPARFQARKADYARSGFDQGHMAPAADFSTQQDVENESFYYTNVVPQDSDLNRHFWAQLEKKVRTWAARRGELFVVTGPVYGSGPPHAMGRDAIAVPDALFKVVYDPNSQSAIAFLVPNRSIPEADIPKYVVTMQAVEDRTGLRFFPNLPQGVRDRAESHLSGLWTR